MALDGKLKVSLRSALSIPAIAGLLERLAVETDFTIWTMEEADKESAGWHWRSGRHAHRRRRQRAGFRVPLAMALDRQCRCGCHESETSVVLSFASQAWLIAEG